MKKSKTLILSLMLASLSFSYVSVNAYAGEVPMQGDDPTGNQDNPQKSPVEPPYVWQEGYSFTFDESCLGCTLRLVDESNTVVYTTVITSDTVVLPSTFSGNYELQVIRGIWCFYGFIEL